MKRIKDFIMSFRGKWCIWLITNIITILLIFYVNIKFVNLIKGHPYFGISLFFICIMCLLWLIINLYCIKSDFEFIKNKNRYFTLQDFFLNWCFFNFIVFLLYGVLYLGTAQSISENEYVMSFMYECAI